MTPFGFWNYHPIDVWLAQPRPQGFSLKKWVGHTLGAILFLSSDERQFGRSQATWIHQAKQESLATVYITWK